jgi:O-acetyl-ADP-ribose deacetylase (regulator of RNase III)
MEAFMEIKINKSILSLVEGDITRQDTEAIVNAANKSLRGGGGVDGAIHRAGGPRILEECIKIGGCDTGEAVITTGGNLKARYVIHTVDPVYRDGLHNEPKLLENAYKNSLILASSRGIKSIAFPSISTGAYRYPLEEAAEVALRTAITYLREHNDIELVRFVLFGKKALEAYEKAIFPFLSSVQSK